VLEQTVFNAVLAGVSLRGNEFFYVNPLESDGSFRFNHGSAGRQPWFEVSCCPTSLCRFLPSFPGLMYASTDAGVYVNLFAAGQADIKVGEARVRLVQETEYPWDGNVRITVHPERALSMKLFVRIPSWARNQIMGGRLYSFEQPSGTQPTLSVNGRKAEVPGSGYAVLDREWNDGDVVELSLPMPVRKVVADERVTDCRGKAAIMRGPLVYCVEGRDADESLDDLSLGKNGLEAVHMPDLLGGVVAVRGRAFTAVPYCTWANRGPGPMRVWLRNVG